MILIADGGSTKTEWRLIDGTDTSSFSCAGINPFFNSREQILAELNKLELEKENNTIDEVFFYGAGITAGKAQEELEKALHAVFKNAKVSLNDDLTAADRALFADDEGIACILGTGSNSGLFRNGKLVDKIPALGYIIGDEGSGADIGIRFLNALLKRKLPEDISERLISEGLEMNNVLDKVYRERLPNRYLASMTKIVKNYIHINEIREIVLNAFNSFVEKNILGYDNPKSFQIGFVGSVAWHFEDELKEIINKHELKLKKIIQQPIEDLVVYHRELIK